MLGDILRAIKAECNRKDESSMRDAILNVFAYARAYWLLFVCLIAMPALAIWKLLDLATYFASECAK
jgi:hypothetical protein